MWSSCDLQKCFEHVCEAFYGRRGRGRGRGGRFNSSGRGFGPAINHNQRPFKGKTEENQSNSSSNKRDDAMVCQICEKRNHTTIRCWSRFDHSVQPEDELPQALVALRINDDLDPTLYVDSGATTHIMNHTGKISKLTPYMARTHYMLVMLMNFFVKDSQGKLIAKGVKKGDLYALEELRKFALSTITNTASSTIWHHRLGHANDKVLNFLKNKEFISVSNWIK
ncbi:hypothetical protein POM88_026037 [Heracleum sosnowskyi]|uniref:GAG-pre-integrase domain-containing protein n=1 Tax=Heracleum sosnowskyi TaxID=360622 RepID=A0AAD8MPJ2_9APIA|nr:hypothetical protein POM88_026037 [Heracleum sosnowskyi]